MLSLDTGVGESRWPVFVSLGAATPARFLMDGSPYHTRRSPIMGRKPLWSWAGSLIALAMLLSACGGAAQGPTTEGKFQIPAVEDGKFNVAMILIGPHDDGGWSQSHYEGLQFIEKNVPNTHVAYIENVPEGAD